MPTSPPAAAPVSIAAHCDGFVYLSLQRWQWQRPHDPNACPVVRLNQAELRDLIAAAVSADTDLQNLDTILQIPSEG